MCYTDTEKKEVAVTRTIWETLTVNMDLHKEKRETVLGSVTDGSWITNTFIDKDSFKEDLKHGNTMNMIIFQMFIGIIAQEWGPSRERFDMSDTWYECNWCVKKNEPWVTVLGTSKRKGFSKFSGRDLMEQEGKKSEDITGKVDLQSSKQHFQLHRHEKEKEKGAYGICSKTGKTEVWLYCEEKSSRIVRERTE